MNDPIYLDYNATTPVLPEAVDAMLPYLREGFGNPSSGHVYGVRAKEAVARGRTQVAAFIGCDPDELIFTSGGTEANNLAIRGVAAASSSRRHLVTSVIEHPATARPCAQLEREGWGVTRVSVDSDGRIVVDEAVAALSAQTALVTVMHSNNETGVIQPVADITKAARDAGALVHLDAAQSLGKVLLSARELGVDLLSLAGHKLYAPKGIGALYVRKGTALRPFALGGGQEQGVRPGTENVPYIVALGVACAQLQRELTEVSQRVRTLRDELWSRLREQIPGLALNGHPDQRLPNTLSVRFPRVTGTELLAATPEVAASTGSACHAGHETAPAVITAMGVDSASALGTVRLTLGRGTTRDEVFRSAAAMTRAWSGLTGAS